jgi:hypothetical protein
MAQRLVQETPRNTLGQLGFEENPDRGRAVSGVLGENVGHH